MKSTSCSVPGTVAAGNVSSFFGFQWILAILEPSGNGLPLPGMPASVGVDHHGIGEDRSHQAVRPD